MKPAFEELILPKDVRFVSAGYNLAWSLAMAGKDEAEYWRSRLSSKYPWLESHISLLAAKLVRATHAERLARILERSLPRVPYATLFLRGPCQLSCGGCATNRNVYRPTGEEVSFDKIEPLLSFLVRNCSLRLIRVTGAGEPTISPEFLKLCSWARPGNVSSRGVKLVVCTNGIPLARNQAVLEEYRSNRNLYFYVKLLGDEALQAGITGGFTKDLRVLAPFEKHPKLGLVPREFVELWEISASRVGIRVTISSANERSILPILLEKEKSTKIHAYIDQIKEIGEAGGREELLPSQQVGCRQTDFLWSPARWPLSSLAIDEFGTVIMGMPESVERAEGPTVVGVDPAGLVRHLFSPGRYSERMFLGKEPALL